MINKFLVFVLYGLQLKNIPWLGKNISRGEGANFRKLQGSRLMLGGELWACIKLNLFLSTDGLNVSD